MPEPVIEYLSSEELADLAALEVLRQQMDVKDADLGLSIPF